MPLVQITLIEGRPADKMTALIKAVTDGVEQSIGAPRESIRVVIDEVPASQWGVAGEPKG